MDKKIITKEELNTMLNKHEKWLLGKRGGKRLDLENADLAGFDLSTANLTNAILCRCNLRGANLEYARLISTNLEGSDFSMADLSYADLAGSTCIDTNFSNTDLTFAKFTNAVCIRTVFNNARTLQTTFTYARLKNSILENISRVPPLVCPEKGSFIGFKKSGCGKIGQRYIIELEIPAHALRSSATSRKCRCSEAKVLSITNLDGAPATVSEICSHQDPNFIYRVGETVKVDDFDTNRWNECAPGIHFFITRQEAIEY